MSPGQTPPPSNVNVISIWSQIGLDFYLWLPKTRVIRFLLWIISYSKFLLLPHQPSLCSACFVFYFLIYFLNLCKFFLHIVVLVAVCICLKLFDTYSNLPPLQGYIQLAFHISFPDPWADYSIYHRPHHCQFPLEGLAYITDLHFI